MPVSVSVFDAGTSNVTTRARCFESSASLLVSAFVVTEMTACMAGIVALAGVTSSSSALLFTGSWILASAAGGAGFDGCGFVGEEEEEVEEVLTAFWAKRVSMWPLVGASLFHSEAVVAGASGGGAPTFPV